MKISYSATAAAIVLFFITLVLSNPLVSTTSLGVKGQRRAIVPERKSVDVRNIPTHRSYSIGDPIIHLKCS